MSGAPIYDIEGREPYWTGMPLERALAWTAVLIARRPSWPGAGPMWMLSRAFAEGRPAGIAGWARRARVAELIGLDPDRYRLLQESLDRVPAVAFRSHPDNDLDRSWPLHPLRPFDQALWSPWSALVEDGLDPDAATRLVLTARDIELRVSQP